MRCSPSRTSSGRSPGPGGCPGSSSCRSRPGGSSTRCRPARRCRSAGRSTPTAAAATPAPTASPGPTHEYLGLDAGADFDRKIVVKINAVERLRVELAHPSWQHEHVAMGTNTDPYQRAEGKYRLTRGIIGELARSGTPFSILTKSAMVTRDLDVLTEAATQVELSVMFSIGTLDPTVWRATEPGAPHPRRRLDAMRAMADGRHPHRCPDRAGPARSVRPPRPAHRDGRRDPGRRRVGHRRPAALPPRRDAGALPDLARAVRRGSACALRAGLPQPGRAAGRPTRRGCRTPYGGRSRRTPPTASRSPSGHPFGGCTNRKPPLGTQSVGQSR